MTFYNKFVIYWVYMIVFMNMINSLSRVLFTPLVVHTFVGVSNANLMFKYIDTIVVNLIIPISDYITLLSFLYLFN